MALINSPAYRAYVETIKNPTKRYGLLYGAWFHGDQSDLAPVPVGLSSAVADAIRYNVEATAKDFKVKGSS